MKEQYFTNILKLKKIHAMIIGTIIIVLLIKLLGVDFFLIDMYYDAKSFMVDTKKSIYLLETVAIRNLKHLLFIIILLELKHGTKYKYIIISLNTMISFIIFLNIFHISENVWQMTKMIAIYMPKYVNTYIFVFIQEKITLFIEAYNRCDSFAVEIKNIMKILIILTISIVVTAVLQSILLIFLF